MTKLIVKRHYKNYRIINSDTNILNPPILLSAIQQKSPFKDIHSKSNPILKVETRERSKSDMIKPIKGKEKLKGYTMELPSIIKYDKDTPLTSQLISSKSILSHPSMKSISSGKEIEDMKNKFIKKYMKFHT